MFLHGSRLLTELALNRGGWGASQTFGRHNSKVGKGTTGFIIITTRISIQRKTKVQQALLAPTEDLLASTIYNMT